MPLEDLGKFFWKNLLDFLAINGGKVNTPALMTACLWHRRKTNLHKFFMKFVPNFNDFL